MHTEEEQTNTLIEIPQGAIVVQQSSWAWLWSMVPWAGFATVSVFIDQITFIGLPLIFAAILIVPKYVRWRRTAFILTSQHLVIIQGSFGKAQRLDLPVSQIDAIQTKPGFFGRSLGYMSILLSTKDYGVVHLPYIPEGSNLIENIRRCVDPSLLLNNESADT